MDRSERFQALAQMPIAAACGLADRILDGSLGEVALITPPTVGMVMARITEAAKGEVFNLGEVLVTEARVSIRGKEGWGMVLGGNPTHALAVAIVDAGLEAGHQDAAGIERDIQQVDAELRAQSEAEWAKLAPTRVEFENF